jgi:hypothetical protein
MKNVAIVDSLTRNEPSAYVGRVEKGTFYRLSFNHIGDGTLRFWIVDEDNVFVKTVLNRMVDMTTAPYVYSFTAPHDGIVVYHINGGEVHNLVLNKFEEGDAI